MRKITLFDLDHTLLPIDSDFEWGVFTTRIGWTDPAYFTAQNEQFYADYKRGALDIAAYVRFATAAIREKGALASERAHRQFMSDVIVPVLTSQALALVTTHKNAGDEVVIVTATNEFVTYPIAKALGVTELIAVQLAGYRPEALPDATQAWITGEIDGIASVREGKVQRVAQWLTQRGLSWDDVFLTFYSDSINDLPLLERVHNPIATNPDEALRAVATQRQWPILELFEKR